MNAAMAPFQFENKNARLEVRADFAFVRKLDENGCGGAVIEATLKPRQREALNLRADQRERLRVLQGLNLDTATAYQMKLTLQDFYEQPNPRAAATFLEDWCELARQTGLEPLRKVAQTLAEHAEGVLRWFTSRITNGLLEGINSIIQAAKAKARGYRTTRNLITIAYLLAGKLDLTPALA